MSESRADSTVAAADAAKDSAASPMPLAGIDIREVLRRQGEATAAEVGELLAADQMARWQRGQRIPAEAYLQLHPAVAADGSEAFDLVFNEYCLREELGERPAVEEYLWRFPRFAERFRRQLELHRAVGEVQAEPVTDAPAATEASTADPTLRQWPTVPGYEVLSELGRGGMGVVYKARQVGLRRLVALKMILQGARAGAELFARFRREAQVIARLQHPHIVQIHEIGEQDGQPFFSMELVAGGSLADHLEGTPLNPGVAAGLVETLARAVHAAHDRGIVHRDLKPANILLQATAATEHTANTETKTAGISSSVSSVFSVAGWIPKISDFGLAKEFADPTAQPAETRQAEPTPSGAIVGSPSYMAPEQAQANAAAIGPATDVYGLGAILYELLTGRPPHKAESALETVMQVLREEPVPLRRLQPKLPRDLETICLKCLQKEPRKRYASALHLAEDLHRFQEGRPILARPIGSVGRAWRWSRRNPVVAGLLGIVSALLVSGTAVSCYFAVQALQAETQAKTARDQALESEADTEAFNRFLVDDVLAVARPEGQNGGLGIGVTVRQALDAAAPNVARTFAGRPRAELRTRDALGRTYVQLGEWTAAIRELERVRELCLQQHGPAAAHTVGAMTELAYAYRGAGRIADSVALLEDTVRLAEANLGPGDPGTLKSMSHLARVYRMSGRLDQAIPLHERVLEAKKAKFGPDDLDAIVEMNALAGAYQAVGRLAEALPLHEEALELNKAKLGPDHPNTLKNSNDLAIGYYAAGRLAEATKLFEQILPRMKAVLGVDHPDTLNCMNGLSVVYKRVGKLDEALALLGQTLELKKSKLGLDHPATLVTMSNLAMAYQHSGQLDRAIALHEQVLEKRKAKLPPDHPSTLTTMNNLASAYLDAGQLDAALKLFEETLPLMKAKLGPDHPSTLTLMNNLAGAYQDAGRLADALALLQEVLQKRRQQRPVVPAEVGRTLVSLGWVLTGLDQAGDAEPFLREGLALQEKHLPPGHGDTALTRSWLGGCLAKQQKFAEAESLLLQGYQGLTQGKATRPERLRQVREALVQLYTACGQHDKAETWRKEGPAKEEGR